MGEHQRRVQARLGQRSPARLPAPALDVAALVSRALAARNARAAPDLGALTLDPGGGGGGGSPPLFWKLLLLRAPGSADGGVTAWLRARLSGSRCGALLDPSHETACVALGGRAATRLRAWLSGGRHVIPSCLRVLRACMLCTCVAAHLAVGWQRRASYYTPASPCTWHGTKQQRGCMAARAMIHGGHGTFQ